MYYVCVNSYTPCDMSSVPKEHVLLLQVLNKSALPVLDGWISFAHTNIKESVLFEL